MERIRLKLLGLSRNISQNNAYTLVLADTGEHTQIPVTIGLPEAQSIALLMENILWERPFMFQLLNMVAHEMGADLEEVFLRKVEGNQFHTDLVFRTADRRFTIDARISDAVILAVYNMCPMYTTPDILKRIGRPLSPEDVQKPAPTSVLEEFGPFPAECYSTSDLRKLVAEAVEREEYELAAKIKQIIKEREQ